MAGRSKRSWAPARAFHEQFEVEDHLEVSHAVGDEDDAECVPSLSCEVCHFDAPSQSALKRHKKKHNAESAFFALTPLDLPRDETAFPWERIRWHCLKTRHESSKPG